jgi:hypothetical protein
MHHCLPRHKGVAGPNRTEEVQEGGVVVKTMAIRVQDGLHAQYALLAQLDGVSLTEEIRRALDAHLERKRSEPGFVERAEAVLAEVDQEAATRRDAIAGLLAAGGSPKAEPAEGQPGPGKEGRRGRKRS